jgi:hypothetical protein
LDNQKSRKENRKARRLRGLWQGLRPDTGGRIHPRKKPAR